MQSNKFTIIAAGAAFALGAAGANAVADDDVLWTEAQAVELAQRDGPDERDDQGRHDRIDGVRDDQGPDLDERDDEDDQGDSNGDRSRNVPDTHSGGTNDGRDDRSGSAGNQPTGGDSVAPVTAVPAAAPTPAPAPAPVYDDYSDDGYAGGGSDYGDS